MEEPAVPPQESINRDGKTVTIEFLCAKCSYNLYGRPIDQPCPECGADVRLMLPKGELVYFFSMAGKRPLTDIWQDRLGMILQLVLPMVIACFVLILMDRETGMVLSSWATYFSALLIFIIVVTHMSKWKNYRIIFGSDEVHYTRSPTVMGRLPRSMVRRIRDNGRRGLELRDALGTRSCDIPCEMENYDQLRSLVEQWGPLTHSTWLADLARDCLISGFIVVLLCFKFPAMMGCAFSRSPGMLLLSILTVIFGTIASWMHVVLGGNKMTIALWLETILAVGAVVLGVLRISGVVHMGYWG